MSTDGFSPNWFSKPGDTLVTLMHRKGIGVRQLAEVLGVDIHDARALVVGAMDLDANAATAIASLVGGSADFWRKRQADYRNALERAVESVPREDAAAWLRELPLRDMREQGWIESATELKTKLQLCMVYFGVSGPEEWYWRYTNSRHYNFRTSSTFRSDGGALAAWLRQGEIEAAMVQTGSWDADKLNDQIPTIRRLTWARHPSYFVPRLKALLAEAGVALVFARAPTGCRASGAARFLNKRRAMVQMSFRYRADDHVWFTLFHEIAHLILHGRAGAFVDGDELDDDGLEAEANEFAQNAVVPKDRRGELEDLPPRTADIVAFAKDVGVAPGIVVGQLQHFVHIGREQLNFLKRRYHWDDVTKAFS